MHDEYVAKSNDDYDILYVKAETNQPAVDKPMHAWRMYYTDWTKFLQPIEILY